MSLAATRTCRLQQRQTYSDGYNDVVAPAAFSTSAHAALQWAVPSVCGASQGLSRCTAVCGSSWAVSQAGGRASDACAIVTSYSGYLCLLKITSGFVLWLQCTVEMQAAPVQLNPE